MDVSHLLDELNPAQREVVSAPPGHYLVLAGAGSGKTRVLTHRIGWLNEVVGVPAHGILAVTFTNKAAGEMRGRVGRAAARRHARHVDRHLPRPGASPAAPALAGSRPAGKLPGARRRRPAAPGQARRRRSWSWTKAASRRGRSSWWINAQKDEGRRPKHIQVPGGDFFTRDHAARVYEDYESRCQRAGLVDFAEILLRAHEAAAATHPALLHHYQQRFGQILVDEFQDTNTIQYAFIRLLAGDTGQVFVVGDDDQAIYGWRGAKVENVQRFLRDYPGAQTFKLEQNYRSTGNILGAANAVIAHNPERLGKQLWTDDGEGEPIDLYAAYNEDRRGALRGRAHPRLDRATAAAPGEMRDAVPQQRAVARVRRSSCWPAQPAVPRLRRPALLRAHRNQGRAGLPAPGRQPRRRRRVRARGEHADARHRRTHPGRSAPAARAHVACRCGRRRCGSARGTELAGRARNALRGVRRR